MRAPQKSPTMGGQQRCRHGESAHLCPWCSYDNGKEDGRKAERARIVALARAMAEQYPDHDHESDARDALLELATRIEQP